MRTGKTFCGFCGTDNNTTSKKNTSENDLGGHQVDELTDKHDSKHKDISN
jgi:uncharacterized Zn finger protein (UPF0148 family)